MKSYYTLVASLPLLPKSFDAGPIPITARTLYQRLSLLEADDRQVIRQLSDFFLWDRQPFDHTDAEVLAEHRRLTAEIRSPLVDRVVRHRFEMRTLVAATRCQRDGLPSPLLPDLSVSQSIRRNWDQPYFRLNSRFPWLEPFVEALDDEQPLQGQRVLFEELWRLWSRLNQSYHFSFESVVLYLARWEILFRWASHNAQQGQRRFEDLVESIVQKSRQSHPLSYAEMEANR